MTRSNDEALIDVMTALRDGQVFYEEARNSARSPELRQLFARMADERAAGLVKLTPYLDAPAPDEETWAALADRLYADLLALVSDPDAVYLDRLREQEAELIRTVEAAVPDVAPGAARDAVEEVLEACRRTRSAMRELNG